MEGKFRQAHYLKPYNSLLMVMAKSINFDHLVEIMEEISIARFGLFSYAYVWVNGGLCQAFLVERSF